jgi:hypothetical protein
MSKDSMHAQNRQNLPSPFRLFPKRSLNRTAMKGEMSRCPGNAKECQWRGQAVGVKVAEVQNIRMYKHALLLWLTGRHLSQAHACMHLRQGDEINRQAK